MYLLIDNYDSFTYNIYQYLCELTTKEVMVVRNDRIRVEEISELRPEAIIISPGPGRPENAGVTVETIRRFAGRIPILGVCLGHQAIGYALGGAIVGAKKIVHGKTENMKLDGRGLFRTLPATAVFTRYHSLVIDPKTVPSDLEVTAWSQDGEIMGVRHKKFVLEGIQFHPESIASEFGRDLLKNFLNYQREPFPVREKLAKVIGGENLTRAEAEGFMGELTDGNLNTSNIAGYLVALNAKGIVPEEIAGCASVLQRKRIPLPVTKPVVDTCGTGGDGIGTFNISSFAALIAASCGAVVAKHGNRAVSSLSGSADFYHELGIPIELKPAESAELIEKTGFAFLFAPIYHGAMRFAGPVRRDLGMKTIMNLLGPLANPAGAEYQLIGVFEERFCEPVAKAAKMLGLKRVMVVHGDDGQDEISVTGPTRIITIDETGKTRDEKFQPESLGIRRYPLDAMKGGPAKENAAVALELLDGGGPEALREAVLVNAGAALAVYGTARDLSAGYAMARTALADGSVKRKLAQIKECGAVYEHHA